MSVKENTLIVNGLFAICQAVQKDSVFLLQCRYSTIIVENSKVCTIFISTVLGLPCYIGLHIGLRFSEFCLKYFCKQLALVTYLFYFANLRLACETTNLNTVFMFQNLC